MKITFASKYSIFYLQGTSSLVEIFDKLASKLSGEVLRLRVDEDYLQWSIAFKNQPAVDTGFPTQFLGIVTSDGSVPSILEEA